MLLNVHVYMYVVVFFGLKNQFILSFCLTQIVLIVVRQSQNFKSKKNLSQNIHE